jgi:hypothetical protein
MQTTYRTLDATKILARRGLATVLNDRKTKAPRSKNTRLNLALFRRACCRGLRESEIAKLRVADVRAELARPHIHSARARRRADGHEWFRCGGTQAR